MALTDQQLVDSMRAMVEDADAAGVPFNHAKADLRAAFQAADAWATANAASFNAALPQPFRGAASASEKAQLLAFVCLRRAGK